MTGFGSAGRNFKSRRGQIEISAEIRTVNSKFLDIAVKSPRLYLSFDTEIGKTVRQFLKRGRIDISLSMRVLEGTAEEVIINLPQAEKLYSALNEVREKLKIETSVNLSDLLKIPDWIESKEAQFDLKEELGFVKSVVEEALKQVLESRKKEGKALEAAIESHRDTLGEGLEKVGRTHDTLLQNLRDRLKERVKSLYGSDGFDPHRLEQEITLWVARSDFREELDRIRHHLETFDKLSESEGEMGRKLEFLTQELHREVNTLGSKCPDAKMTPTIIEMKTCIERIREQIQNIE
ncbi:MAG: YicC family protein [Deltaproteobacteria bacterium]|nr:YicC family protein [Deltaproteobacteria bacterium]